MRWLPGARTPSPGASSPSPPITSSATASCRQLQPQPADSFIRRFWNHPQNRMDLRLEAMCDELSRAGDLFVVLFRNPQDGMSYIRFVTKDRIASIETAPNDWETELAYYEMQPIRQKPDAGSPAAPARLPRPGCRHAALRRQPPAGRAAGRERPDHHAALAAALLAHARRPGAPALGGARLPVDGHRAGQQGPARSRSSTAPHPKPARSSSRTKARPGRRSRPTCTRPTPRTICRRCAA